VPPRSDYSASCCGNVQPFWPDCIGSLLSKVSKGPKLVGMSTVVAVMITTNFSRQTGCLRRTERRRWDAATAVLAPPGGAYLYTTWWSPGTGARRFGVDQGSDFLKISPTRVQLLYAQNCCNHCSHKQYRNHTT
jgi:hypothetical protein